MDEPQASTGQTSSSHTVAAQSEDCSADYSAALIESLTHARHHLPLGDFVHGIDGVHAFNAILTALMPVSART